LTGQIKFIYRKEFRTRDEEVIHLNLSLEKVKFIADETYKNFWAGQIN
jgi:hypothetical protein